MNHKAKYGVLLLLAYYSEFGFTASVSSYWQCGAYDSSNKLWTVKNHYQKIAFHLAFSACKKESQMPASCTGSIHDCKGFNQSLRKSTTPLWHCTSIDAMAEAWQSNLYAQRDEAALAAKAICKTKSAIPDTCYVHTVTCLTPNSDL